MYIIPPDWFAIFLSSMDDDIFTFVSSPNDIHPPFLPAWFDTIFVFCISIVTSERPNIHPPSPLEAVFSFNLLFNTKKRIADSFEYINPPSL